MNKLFRQMPLMSIRAFWTVLLIRMISNLSLYPNIRTRFAKYIVWFKIEMYTVHIKPKKVLFNTITPLFSQ